MPRDATGDPPLTSAERGQRDRQTRDPLARRHWHLLGLVAHQRGHPPLRSPARRAAVAPGAGGSASGWGLWTCAKVAAVVADRLGRSASRRSALGPAPPRRTRPPRRPVHKGGHAAIDAVRRAHPTAHVRLWAEDEHRLGWLPVIRRVWAPRGVRPTAWGNRRYQWRYVDAGVRSTTGQSWWCLLPPVSTEAMLAALAAFAHDERIDATHRVVLVRDGAGWHTSQDRAVPEGIDLVSLPPASPELQPVERVWSLLDEPVATRTVADRDEREPVLVKRCRGLRRDRRRVTAPTRFPWWPRERRSRNHQ